MKKTTYNAKLAAMSKAMHMAENNEGKIYGVFRHGRKFTVHHIDARVDKRYELTEVVQYGYKFRRGEGKNMWKGTPKVDKAHHIYYPACVVWV